MTFDLNILFGVVVHLNPILVKSVGQGRRTKSKVTGDKCSFPAESKKSEIGKTNSSNVAEKRIRIGNSK